MPVATHTSTAARIFSFIGLAAGVFVIVALVAQIADQVARESFVPERYFSYFSIQTSIANAVFLIASGAIGLWGGRKPLWAARIRACLVAYAVMTAVVYELLLSARVERLDPGARLLEWPIEATHVWIPIYFALDWFIRRDRPRLAPGIALWGMAYPAAWLVFSFARGALTGWYPYDFMNPTLPGGPGSVALIIAAIGALYAASMAIVLGVNRLHQRSTR